MNYPDGTRISGARLETKIIVNRKSVRVRWNVFEIETDKCRIYRIQILDTTKLKFKGDQEDGGVCYEIFSPVKNMIKHYYESVKEQLSDGEYKGLPCLVLQYLLSFEIVDGNSNFADSVIDKYLNCFE
jgi:hypothetical protein